MTDIRVAAEQARVAKRHLILNYLAKWENANGSLCAITPDEWMALMEPVANLAMLESPRQSLTALASLEAALAALPGDTSKEQALDLIGELEAVRTINTSEGYILASGLHTLRRFIEQAGSQIAGRDGASDEIQQASCSSDRAPCRAASAPLPSLSQTDESALPRKPYSYRLRCTSCENGSGPNGCTDCLGRELDPSAFAGGIEGALNDAYAEGRKDEAEEWQSRARPTPAAAADAQSFMVTSIKHKAGIVTLCTLNAEDVLPPLESGQVVMLVAASPPAAAAGVPTGAMAALKEWIDAEDELFDTQVPNKIDKKAYQAACIRASNAKRLARALLAASPVAPAGAPTEDLVPMSVLVEQRRRMGAEYDELHAELQRVREVARVALLSAGSQAERLVGEPQEHSVHAAAPGGEGFAPPRSEPCATGRSELPREPQTDTSGRSHPRYAEACAVVRKQKRASISTVQRHLLIGYNTAAMLLEAMVGDVIAEMPPTTKLLKERA